VGPSGVTVYIPVPNLGTSLEHRQSVVKIYFIVCVTCDSCVCHEGERKPYRNSISSSENRAKHTENKERLRITVQPTRFQIIIIFPAIALF